MPRMTNAEFLQKFLDVNESLKSEGQKPVLSDTMEKKIQDVLKNAKNINADQEMTNLLFNQLFKKDTREI